MEKLSVQKQLLVSKHHSWTKELHCRYFATATLLWSSINPCKLWGWLSPSGLLVVSDHRHGVHLREGKDHGGIHLARGRKKSSRIGKKTFLYPSHKSQPSSKRASSTRTTSGNSTLQFCLPFPTQENLPKGTPLSTQVANAQLYAQEIGHQALQGKKKSDQTLKKFVKILTLEVDLPPW